ncbi:MAG: hypothetical protein WKF84_25145 [Pyrinomonadaceae bacterium]
MMLKNLLRVRRLGHMEYEEAYAAQKEAEQAVKDGAPSALLFVEHPHVLTTGRNATLSSSGVIASPELLCCARHPGN